MAPTIDLLVLGLGNLLYGDDGLGVVTVRRLARHYRVPAGVRLADGGTLGLFLLPLLGEARRVLIVDAIRRGRRAPGSIVRLEGADVAPAVRERLSPHEIGVADLLDGAALLGCPPARMVLLGLVPDRLAFGVGLSPAVERRVPALVRRIVAEAEALGHAFCRRLEHERAPRVGDLDDLPGVFGVRGAREGC